jgi:hypothetical protein
VKIAHETRYTGFLPKNSLREVEGVGIRISIVSVTRVVQNMSYLSGATVMGPTVRQIR